MSNAMTHPGRKEKTRDALRQALTDLVQEKPYDRVSVLDIIRRADVSRSNFYVHFRDKDDLLLSGFEDIGVSSYDDLFEPNSQNASYPDFSIVLFRGTEKWKEISRAMLTYDAHNPAYFHMRNMLVIKTREWLKTARPDLASPELESTVHYLASALQGLLTWWVTNDFPYPAETMSNHFNQLAISGLEGLLHLDPSQIPD